MKSIMITYPDFQSLPRGIKIMLLTSEDFFFGEDKSVSVKINIKPIKPKAPLPSANGRLFSPWAAVALRDYGVKLEFGTRSWPRRQ